MQPIRNDTCEYMILQIANISANAQPPATNEMQKNNPNEIRTIKLYR